jgi:hypothetical protein
LTCLLTMKKHWLRFTRLYSLLEEVNSNKLRQRHSLLEEDMDIIQVWQLRWQLQQRLAWCLQHLPLMVALQLLTWVLMRIRTIKLYMEAVCMERIRVTGTPP